MDRYQEKNRKTLIEGVRSLPLHSPPPGLWNNIETQLDNRMRFQQAIDDLPQYAPPSRVWEQLEAALDQPAAGSKSLRIRRLISKPYRWAAVAAVACGLIAGVWLLFPADPAPLTSIVYSEETLTAPPVSSDWNTEESSFALVLQQVDQSPVADANTVQRLKLEYHELTDARQEVEDMMQRYGKDADLLKEVARIERERTKVIKELAAWI
jgi:hypothetical protein